MAQRVSIDPGSLLAFNVGASATVGGLCHAADRQIRWAARASGDSKPSMMRVRAEMPCDATVVHGLLRQVFPSDAEAGLVDVLRGRTDPQIALVAEDEACGIIGHILFTPVEIRSESTLSRAVGLGPMGVLPALQRQGVGSALVEAGLSACRAAGEFVVVVLGHPSYYPRFGFQPAWDDGLYYRVPGPNPAFMVRELEAGALRGRSGEVLYHEAFSTV